MIPLLDLRRDTGELDRELEAAFSRVLESGRYILGPEVEALEAECASYLGVSHAIGVSSGTDALLAVLMALDVGPGDEVVCPTYSFFATAGAVWRLGARPVFVDVEEDTFNLDPAKLAAALTERTCAIVVVHLFGQCADMPAIRAIAGDIPIIEDAAQAIGAEIGRVRAGKLGRAACFSFFPSKNLGAIGDAGLVTTDDDALAERVRRLRVHGAATKYFHSEVGGNFRIDELQAALLRVKLRRLDAAIEARRRHAGEYTRALAGTSVVPPRERLGRHVYHQYVVRIAAGRDRVQAHLSAQGIGTAVYYPLPLHLQECFASLGHRAGDLPIAERLAHESLAIPMFPELRDEERDRVVEALLETTR